MKTIQAAMAALIITLVGLTGTARASAAEELRSPPWVSEVIRHLYRWYMDEGDMDTVCQAGEVVVWVRDTTPPLDEGDRSRFGEVVLPQFSLLARVKRADYEIPELQARVQSDTYRISSVERLDTPPSRPDGSTELHLDYKKLREELFRTRNQGRFPEGELLERLRTAVRRELAKDPELSTLLKGEQTRVVYLAPLSPVANEVWAYSETGRVLIHVASDLDLADPAVWDHAALSVRLFPLDGKVVVSMTEVAGSNAFMTRGDAGRVLFNCIVLGRRVELPAAPSTSPR